MSIGMKVKKEKILLIAFLSFFAYVLIHLSKIFFRLDKFPLFLFRYFVISIFIFYAFLKKDLTTWILLSIIIGIEFGIDYPKIAIELRFLSQIFLRLIKTIIAPILFSTLVVGIASHSNIKQLGNMGWKSLLYFEIVTTLALFIGLIAINISQAGVGIVMPSGIMEHQLPKVESKTWQDTIIHVFPENFIKSIYHGDVLPIVVFSVIFGISMVFLDEKKRRPILSFTESISEIMFKFTKIIMYFAPIGVGSAIAYTVGHMGLDILYNLFQLLLTLYIALFIFLIMVLFPIILWIKVPLRGFIKALMEPVSLAFATTSSESALPLLMENLEKLGVPRKIIAFVIPTGYSFNLDGTTLYLSLATVFVAQASGIPLSFSQQIFIGLTLILTSKGVAGVPRASLVILLATVSSFGLPNWPILAIIGIDELMDMARTTVNVIGNGLASCVIARSEGELDDEKMLDYIKKSDNG
ncbi:dicarboxylate/amino acid:cation symporter [Blattabacterium punctulatus]|uniref:Dicarboxylate/amino acid:cation symporter n=1 Tax=Blattabacterium punctulatus TaxID=164514 RepID=A0ABN5M228_9FLAO|nr:cation:dicarboxylase symporter family transporter [Blattabacterium punctulatus]AWU39876.1 dicarboxylate/amino acid:cation symporter [Blattabacterium punctulatus]AWU40421.1 dicarboxylate/amino acid:cation symporter [Blattabacterium punctulatus]